MKEKEKAAPEIKVSIKRFNNQSGDSICQICDADNPAWYAENELFNRINGEAREDGVYCPVCFAGMAKDKGIDVIFKCITIEEDNINLGNIPKKEVSQQSFEECKNTIVSGFTCACETKEDCSFHEAKQPEKEVDTIEQEDYKKSIQYSYGLIDGNSHAIEIIKNRIAELEEEIENSKGFHTTWLVQRVNELNNILKLIKS